MLEMFKTEMLSKNGLKQFYKGILHHLLENRKFLFWSFSLFAGSFILGLINPNFMISYQEKLITDLLAVSGGRVFGVVSKIIFTNLWAAILGIFSGVLLLPVLLLSLFNGYMFGAVVSRSLAIADLSQVLMNILPHALFEIPAIIISYGLGLAIGFTWFNVELSWKKRGLEIIKKYKDAFFVFMAIIIPLVILAGIIEGILFKYHVFLSQFRFIVYSLVLLYLFYAVLKGIKIYLMKRNPKHILVIAAILLAASGLWMEAYGLRVKELLESSSIFKVLLIMIPFVIFMFYLYLENLRYKEEREKLQISGAFKQYVSPAIIAEIMKHPEKLKLGGQKKELTIFFSDVRSFSAISEKLSPEQLVHLLNEYLSAMTDIILKHMGVVDKYIGDAIMAFWNAPIDEPNHAELACNACIEMKGKLIELRKKWKEDGMPEVRVGIGLNTGEAVVGNMGSSQRFDYTVMGDSVNLSSRLEGLNKVYGAEVTISESTYEQVKDKFACRDLDLVTVKGKTKPVKIFDLICKKGDLTKEEERFIGMFEDALAKYREGNWLDAIKGFNKCLELKKNEKSCLLFIKRCGEFKKHPPKDWKGVYEMKTK